MSTEDGQTFVEGYLAHAYDPVKAHEYYLRKRKLKGRKPGQAPIPSTATRSRRSRATNIGSKAMADVGTREAAAIMRLTDKAKADLLNLTEEFRSWVSSNPKASDKIRFAKRKEMLDRKDDIVRTLKSDVAKITSAASSTSKNKAATEGRQH